MMPKDLDLSPVERSILESASNLEITRRRIRAVIVMGLVFASLLGLMALQTRSWKFVTVIALCYVALTVWEKVVYGRTVIAYKNLVTKLAARLEAEGVEVRE